nr:hypothetical protein [Propionivibrio sp.]
MAMLLLRHTVARSPISGHFGAMPWLTTLADRYVCASAQGFIHDFEDIARQSCVLPERLQHRARVTLVLGIESLPAIETACHPRGDLRIDMPQRKTKFVFVSAGVRFQRCSRRMCG